MVVDAGWWSNGRVSDIRTVAVVVRMVLDDFLQQKKDLFVRFVLFENVPSVALDFVVAASDVPGYWRIEQAS